MRTATTELDRKNASRDLLMSLMGVKGWLRDASHLLYGDHSSASLMVLALIGRTGPSRVSELAEIARVDTSVISRQVAALEQQGYVERADDPADGRAHTISVTASGSVVLHDGRDRLARLVAERLDDWSTEDLTAFSRRLEQLIGRLSCASLDT